ncbi:flagellar biosynthesis protein FliQ [Rhodomicrobium udaipurense JA643]|uniref:Flagellar biosynthetic protein FliQ n=1 Tax=Rhodomicrobium udaipurense TaxID=1202716 RepID=A0A8I1KHW1_9HYPH|nr:flagellar biosynthesis protein FliQ [Rhodomicrobium udaipurense]KAI95109.1 flagellar biosynthesis protein FliQ [Rhodomicrobium udaipurense JA643]MBJ7541992.1 flagellar biosynthesis protein FliQ [Rhodomicrobium udaipurense]
MNQADAMDLVKSAIWAVILASGPMIGAAMAVGIIVSLFQALTQIQEATLTFIPKIVAVFVVAMLTASFIGSVLLGISEQAYSRIEHGF